MGNVERINPQTGVLEEDRSICNGTFGRDWQPIRNDDGRAERINPQTGVHEVDTSILRGTFGPDWQPKK